MGAANKTVGLFGGKTILTVNSANGTFNSGVQMTEAKGFKNWTFALTGTFTGMSVTIYGTIDPAAFLASGQPNTNYPNPGSPGGNWFALNSGPQATAPADVVNPLTANTQYLPYAGSSLAAICAVCVATGATGTVNVLAFASE